jgi:epoxide hydrolase-like predicted phosphatase
MAVHAVLIDLGGVILRTEFQAPREHLAERLNMTSEDLNRIIFDSDSARLASLGTITTDQHWATVTTKLGRQASEASDIRAEFFAGDVIDRELLAFIGGLRPKLQTALISNGWPDLREYLSHNRILDCFDTVVISAEVGVMKPQPQIYQIALDRLGIPPKEAVFVDDIPKNVDAASALGMQGILFRNSTQMLHDITLILR